MVDVKSHIPSINYVWLGLSTTWPERDYATNSRAYSYSNWDSKPPTLGGAYVQMSHLKWIKSPIENDTNLALCESKIENKFNV